MKLEAHHFSVIRDLVRQRASIVLADNKRYLVEARVRALVRALELRGFDELCNLIRRRDPEILQQVVEALTTNETSFFRDQDAFRCLREDVLPRLIAATPAHRPLRIWSSACSSGQELYSVLITINEHFPELLERRLDLYATDIDRQMLERTKSGRYNALEVARGLSDQHRRAYFTAEGRSFTFREDLRPRIRFRQLNLASEWTGLPRFDLILMRYVLIYFDHPTREAVIARAAKHLNPDGFVMLGASETAPAAGSGLETQRFGRTNVLRRATAIARDAA